MRKFKIEFPLYTKKSLPYPSDEAVKNHILINNTEFSIEEDLISNRLFLFCKNKPKDMGVYGISFKEITQV